MHSLNEFNDRSVTFDAYGKKGKYSASLKHTGPETAEAMESFVKDPKYSRIVSSGAGIPKSTPPKKRKYK
jgi:hypothetical protein